MQLEKKPITKVKLYTEEQKQWICDNCKKMTAKEIAEHLKEVVGIEGATQANVFGILRIRNKRPKRDSKAKGWETRRKMSERFFQDFSQSNELFTWEAYPFAQIFQQY